MIASAGGGAGAGVAPDRVHLPRDTLRVDAGGEHARQRGAQRDVSCCPPPEVGVGCWGGYWCLFGCVVVVGAVQVGSNWICITGFVDAATSAAAHLLAPVRTNAAAAAVGAGLPFPLFPILVRERWSESTGPWKVMHTCPKCSKENQIVPWLRVIMDAMTRSAGHDVRRRGLRCRLFCPLLSHKVSDDRC